jgi:hypothetical protein
MRHLEFKQGEKSCWAGFSRRTGFSMKLSPGGGVCRRDELQGVDAEVSGQIVAAPLASSGNFLLQSRGVANRLCCAKYIASWFRKFFVGPTLAFTARGERRNVGFLSAIVDRRLDGSSSQSLRGRPPWHGTVRQHLRKANRHFVLKSDWGNEVERLFPRV